MGLKPIMILQAAYPSRQLSDDSVKLYTMALADIHPVTLQAAIMNLIQTSKFMPSIAEIREEAQKVSTLVNCIESTPDASEAWDMVYKAAVHRGYDNGLETLPEAVRKVATSFWHDICYEPSKNLGVIRAQFRDAYNAYIEREKTQTRIQRAIESNSMLSAAQKENALKLQASVKRLAESKAVD